MKILFDDVIYDFDNQPERDSFLRDLEVVVYHSKTAIVKEFVDD